MDLDKNKVKEIKSEINDALEDVKNKFDIEIEFGRTRFSDSYFTTKMEASVIDENGTAKTKEAVQFERLAKSYGIDSKFELGGRVKTPNGKYLIIDGLNTRARKYPVKLHDRDGKYKMAVEQLNQCDVVLYL